MNAHHPISKLAVLALITPLLAACHSDTPPTASPGSPANGTASGKTVNLAAGVDLVMIRNTQQLHPILRLSRPEVQTALIFAIARRDNPTTTTAASASSAQSGPVILRQDAANAIPAQAPGITPLGWQVLALPDSLGQDWVYAAACPGRNEIWAILDSRPQLTLLRSTDDGQTWTYFSAVKKPADSATCFGLALTDQGQGHLTMFLPTDTDDGHAHGYYHYRTADGCRTWTGPTLEGTDIREADPAASTDTLQDAIKDTQ